MFKPRPMQAEVLAFTAGKMGVSAVPGSGKTHTLSYLAAKLISENYIDENQEILIVTLVNSAVDNFSSRIASFIKQYGLLPDTGYRVRTLHGLAHDIVRERPDLAGLSDNFQIIDERESNEILQAAAESWLKSNPQFIADYSIPDVDPFNDWRLQKQWHDMAGIIGGNFIRVAKDLECTPEQVQEKYNGIRHAEPLLEMGISIYENYQRSLKYRSAIDFDDLIRLALRVLESDSGFLERLQYRWPYILEDEAQDSSRLQETILRLLSSNNGNWVRVGDPNQAIFETFTTAHPKYLRNFLQEPDVADKSLPNSGRSTRSIINLANHLIDWSRSSNNPVEELKNTLTYPLIDPTPPGDPQPNPPDQPDKIFLYDKTLSPDEEINLVVYSIKKWLAENEDKTAAVLVPRNERGAKIVEGLKEKNVPYVELLRSSLSTRNTAKLFASILKFLSNPDAPAKLSEVLETIVPVFEDLDLSKEDISDAVRLLKSCRFLEDFLHPMPGKDWLLLLSKTDVPQKVISLLSSFRKIIVRWQAAVILPVDQLILTIAQDLLRNPAELALAHKMALLMERYRKTHVDWRLPEFAGELDIIAKNQRRLMGFTSEDTGFDPDQHKGKAVVATIHKAKGLEWDRVYLISVNNYDFPFGQDFDEYIGEKWYVRHQLNLPEETIFKLKSLIHNDLAGVHLEEGYATQQARFEYAAERLRLLYVGITRARQELIITWNSGKRGKSQPAFPLQALIYEHKRIQNGSTQ